MPRLAIYVMGLLLLTGSPWLIGCSNSGDSSDQSAATTGGGAPTPIPEDQIGFSTGGEHESSQYRLNLTVGETPTD
ncbi:MAG: hypothetical protein OEU26_34155, partial [Candidatus Tectomicrobia bacterium]|nr:hypothetical protein [Candidatus Tectomicrobia bacterium]